MSECVTVMCAVGNRDNAEAIARLLVEERLAACVQVMPIESWYRWEGVVHHDPELMLLVKTTSARLAAVERRIRALHTYELPEVAAVPIVGGSAAYLDWIRAQVSESPQLP